MLKTDLQNGHAPGGVPCRFLGRSSVLGFLCDEDSVLETSEFVICGAMFTTLNLTFSDKVWKCLEHIQEKRIARRNANRISNCKLPCVLSLYGWQLSLPDPRVVAAMNGRQPSDMTRPFLSVTRFKVAMEEKGPSATRQVAGFSCRVIQGE